jgi:hypothetical protein
MVQVYCIFGIYCSEPRHVSWYHCKECSAPILAAVCTSEKQLKDLLHDCAVNQTELNKCEKVVVLRAVKTGKVELISKDYDKLLPQGKFLFVGSMKYVKKIVESKTFDIKSTYFENDADYKHCGSDAPGSEGEESEGEEEQSGSEEEEQSGSGSGSEESGSEEE